jgi:pimeloyl-ACP methyl ester carboxylesterase
MARHPSLLFPLVTALLNESTFKLTALEPERQTKMASFTSIEPTWSFPEGASILVHFIIASHDRFVGGGRASDMRTAGKQLSALATARAYALAASLLISQVGLAHAVASEDQAAPATKPPTALELSTCTLPGLTQVARCGVLNVPENPERPAERQLAIHFVVIPATDSPTFSDPIVPLMGGPGEDAIGAAAIYLEQFSSLRANRDLLLVDQRGTGQSAPLRCELYSPEQPAASLRDVFPLAAVRQCERKLRARADLMQCGYLRFSSDLEEVRRALGYGPLNLFAGSYGTRAAVVYLRAYPRSVRTAYLGSVVPIDVAQPLPMARTEQVALDSILGACAADSVCHSAFPNLSVEFHEVVARLTSGVSVLVPGSIGKGRLERGRVAEWIRSKLYRPKSAAVVPWLIHQAYLGNWTPMVEGILSDARDADVDLNLGLLFAITCNEDLPFVQQNEILAQTQGTFLSDYRVRQQNAACNVWPRVSLPTGYRVPVRSSVPTMFVSGDADGGTPLWFMKHVAPGFTERVEVVARGQGHTEWSDCISQLYRRLIINGSVPELVGVSCEPIPRPAFKTD